MATLCNLCKAEGKSRKLICTETNEPCMFMRYCSCNGRYHQTDAAAFCKLKLEREYENEQRRTR